MLPTALAAGPLWPLAVYAGLVLAAVAGMIVACHFLGERHRDRTTGRAYESGIQPTGSARLRYPADFYLVGMFFVIFDIETMYVVAWAVAIRDVGWSGYFEVLAFLVVLLAVLVYLWRVGALDWGRQESRRIDWFSDAGRHP